MMFSTIRFKSKVIRSALIGFALAILCIMAHPSFAQSSDRTPSTSKAKVYQNTHVPIETLELAESLQKGGYTIFFRHERTMMEGVLRDRLPYDLTTCDGQRMLSPAGMVSAQEVGQAFKILNIPIESVLASPICRAKEGAKLAFQTVNVTNQLMVQSKEMKRTKEDVDRDFKALVNQPHDSKKNTILIGHLGNVMAIKEMPSEGEAIVLKPDGKSGVQVVGRILSAQWGDIVRDNDRAKNN